MARVHNKEKDEYDLFPSTEWSWKHHVSNQFIEEFYKMRQQIEKLESRVRELEITHQYSKSVSK